MSANFAGAFLGIVVTFGTTAVIDMHARKSMARRAELIAIAHIDNDIMQLEAICEEMQETDSLYRFVYERHPDRLAEIGAKYGMRAEVVPDVCLDGQLISSTRIREHIRKGEIEQANRLLGYELWYRLPVVRGNEIGRTISFPTINQIIPETNIVPRYGVYKSYVEVDGKQYHGVTNIGVKPTVTRRDGTGAVMETHIIDYSGDLYGRNIAVALVRFIRPEVKFSGLDELKQQIARDKENALH